MQKFVNRARLVCFDGDADAAAAAAVAAAAAAQAQAQADAKAAAAAAAASATDARFSQEDLNKILAEDRRKHQAQVAKIQQTLEETLASKNLTTQEREQLAQRLEDMQKETRTKEQQQAHERKQMEEMHATKLEEEKKGRVQWENRFRESMVERSLQDAAVTGDAFQPSQVMTILRQMTRLSESTDEKTGKGTGKFKVVVDFPDTDPTTGEAIVTLHTPESAVKRMKELPAIYGNLFKSGVVSGIGSSSATGGLASGQSGKLDVRKLTPQQYAEVRAKNPELLGLRRDKRRNV
jgi:flagellar motor protein MotB